jgi:hypothetical protein
MAAGISEIFLSELEKPSRSQNSKVTEDTWKEQQAQTTKDDEKANTSTLYFSLYSTTSRWAAKRRILCVPFFDKKRRKLGSCVR